MKTARTVRWLVPCVPMLALGFFAGGLVGAEQPGAGAEAKPRVVTPGAGSEKPLPPPSDATVLFDGTSLEAWQGEGGKPAAWKCEGVKGGAVTIEPGTGGMMTKASFGDCQLHVEFKIPLLDDKHQGQDRGNSGVYVQGRYEVQVLDSYEHETYANGQCGALYGQHPPLVNACRKPEEWQTYDIVFHAAKFDAKGEKTSNATMTVLHNGVIIHEHAELKGTTGSAPGKETPGDGPVYLQDHGHKVQYRNVWVRKL